MTQNISKFLTEEKQRVKKRATITSQTHEEGTAKLVAYAYQSSDNGRIPPDHDVIDLFAQDSVQTEWLQQEARESIEILVQHGEFQPYVTGR